MPNAFYAKKRVFIYHFGEVCVYCANQSVIIPVSYGPKVFPTILLPTRKLTSIITLSRLNRKHLPIQHHNFLKTKQNEIHRSRKVCVWGVKTALVVVLPLCHL